MRLEILYFGGCPTYRGARRTLSEALRAEGLEAELVAVETNEEAERLRFPGSPTIRADGRGLFPLPDRPAWALGCRTYRTPEGLRGSPTAGMVRASLRDRTGTREARPGAPYLRWSGPGLGRRSCAGTYCRGSLLPPQKRSRYFISTLATLPQ